MDKTFTAFVFSCRLFFKPADPLYYQISLEIKTHISERSIILNYKSAIRNILIYD